MGILGGRITVGRLAAIVTVVGLTVVPFVSCSAGPAKLNFHGHEILRNVPPDVDGKGWADADDKPMLRGSDAWLRWVFVVATGAAVLGLVVVGRAAVATAVVGLVATIVFLVGFNAWLTDQAGEKRAGKRDRDAPGMTLEVGAYLTLLGFAVSAADAAAAGRRGRRRAPSG